MNKFTLNTAFYEPIKGLSDKQLGRLFRAIFEYQICGSTEVDSDIAMAFGFFKSQFDLEGAKRMRIAERNRQNGQNGGRPKAGRKAEGEETQKTQRVIEKPKKPSGFSTPFVPPIPPEPPLYPPISPNISVNVGDDAHTHEEDFGVLDDGIDAKPPKEKSCAKKESPLPDGTWVASKQLAEVLLNDEQWMADVSTNKEISIEELQSLIKEFCVRILLTEEGKEISSAKVHFINWLRKRKLNGYEQRKQQYINSMRPYRNPEPDFEGIKAFVARGIASAKPPQ